MTTRAPISVLWKWFPLSLTYWVVPPGYKRHRLFLAHCRVAWSNTPNSFLSFLCYLQLSGSVTAWPAESGIHWRLDQEGAQLAPIRFYANSQLVRHDLSSEHFTCSCRSSAANSDAPSPNAEWDFACSEFPKIHTVLVSCVCVVCSPTFSKLLPRPRDYSLTWPRMRTLFLPSFKKKTI